MQAHLIIAATIGLVIAGLVLALYLSLKSAEQHAAEIADLKQQVTIQTETIKTIQNDAASTKANQDTLFSALNDIRVEAKTKNIKIAIPKKLIEDKSSKALTDWLNADTANMNRGFEALTAVPSTKR